MGNGWIRLDREMFESDIWHDVTTFRLFVYLLAKASYKDGVKMSGIELKRGQYLRSYRKLAEDLAYKERSEEHMSELQSRENLVCRLLLEKKNQAGDHRPTNSWYTQRARDRA